ncbi:calcium-binding protein [Benzoatithermus flavus]|uniref:Hemolysin-type calcium-binding repeat-containing protein n=1 Tax=Benzoatithermus flavus TaxID=3108223 RepID=A0ABU8XXQ8_9PROT
MARPAVRLTDGDDIFLGGVRGERILALAGDDVLLGGRGDDMLFAGAGDDIAFGGIGAGTLAGGPGDDRLFGGAGDDTIFDYADDGADLLRGGTGDDRIYGGRGDTILGGAGDDVLAVEGGVCSGGAGHDELEILTDGEYAGDRFLAWNYATTFAGFEAGKDRLYIQLWKPNPGGGYISTGSDETFTMLDSNHDRRIDGRDDGVDVAGRTMTIDFVAAVRSLDWREGEHRLTLEGATALTLADFVL